MIVGRLVVLRAAAAERVYAPFKVGYEEARKSFEATEEELLDMDEFAIYLQDVYIASDTESPPTKEQEKNTELPPAKRICIKN